MKCIVAGPNIKTFAKIIHSFCKIGEDIYFETYENGLHLKTINSSRSAYFCISLISPFFQKFNPYCNENTTNNDNDDNIVTPTCKLCIKSLLLIFKSLASIEKQQTEYFKLKLNNNRCQAIFKLFCKHDIAKTYHLSYIECESLEAIIPIDQNSDIEDDEFDTQNDNAKTNLLSSEISQPFLYMAKLKCLPKLFSELINQFSNSVEEITFIINSQSVMVKNYALEELDEENYKVNKKSSDIFTSQISCNNSIKNFNHSKRALDTRIQLYPKDFTKYKLNVNICSNNKNVEITFCVKEFKAALLLLEFMESEITFRIECAGKPLLLHSKMDQYYEANFLLATLAEMVVEKEDMLDDRFMLSQLSDIDKCSKQENNKNIKIPNIRKSTITNINNINSLFDQKLENDNISQAFNLSDENMLLDIGVIDYDNQSTNGHKQNLSNNKITCSEITDFDENKMIGDIRVDKTTLMRNTAFSENVKVPGHGKDKWFHNFLPSQERIEYDINVLSSQTNLSLLNSSENHNTTSHSNIQVSHLLNDINVLRFNLREKIDESRDMVPIHTSNKCSASKNQGVQNNSFIKNRGLLNTVLASESEED
ncbi:unnamed protein product [Gordionus sp. m RMFG-2023]|uniref:reticulocyte-binding protein homolog 1-like n=1 Tax=Gordionus sp. m RMFG-2023 TaxID=3053472 RepID=UPI0030E37E4C